MAQSSKTLKKWTVTWSGVFQFVLLSALWLGSSQGCVWRGRGGTERGGGRGGAGRGQCGSIVTTYRQFPDCNCPKRMLVYTCPIWKYNNMTKTRLHHQPIDGVIGHWARLNVIINHFLNSNQMYINLFIYIFQCCVLSATNAGPPASFFQRRQIF